MKKLLNILIICVLLVTVSTNDHVLRLINKAIGGEKSYFEELSIKYYGTDMYGKHLAIVNQAVSMDAEMTQNDIIVPGRDAIVRLHETYNMQKADMILAQMADTEKRLSTGTDSNKFRVLKSSMALFLAVVISCFFSPRRGRETAIFLLYLLLTNCSSSSIFSKLSQTIIDGGTSGSSLL